MSTSYPNGAARVNAPTPKSPAAPSTASTPAPASIPEAIDPVMDMLGGGRIVAFRVDLALAVGSTTAGVLLSQFWFWTNSPTTEKRDGWFWMKSDEIAEQTGLTREEQMTARKRLRNLGVLEEDKRGVPMKQWFRIDKAKLIALLRGYAEAKAHLWALPKDELSGMPKDELWALPTVGNAQTLDAGMPKDKFGHLRKIARGKAQSYLWAFPTDNTENSSETSSEISLNNSSEAPEPPINPPGDQTPSADAEAAQLSPVSTASDALGDLWDMTLPRLAQVVNKPTYETHLRFLMPVALDDSAEPVAVTLAAPNLFTRDWIDKRHKETIEAALAEVLGCCATVRLVLAAEVSQ